MKAAVVLATLLALALVDTPLPALDGPAPEGCTASGSEMPECEYVASSNGGIEGLAVSAGDWTVTITREGLDAPIVVHAGGGVEKYGCGIIRPGDRVTAIADATAALTVGNSGICF